MLLRFTVENFLSIREEVEVTALAAPLKEHRDHLIATRYARHGVVPVVVVYGANASGKSNVLAALKMLRGLILRSFEKGDEKSGMNFRPFLLDADSAQKPTRFSIDFVMDQVRYQFGLSYNKAGVVEEWLFSFPKQLKQVLYSRDKNEEVEYRFGRSLVGPNRVVQSITRSNSLYLSAASKSGHPFLSAVFTYFKDNLEFVTTSGRMREEVAQSLFTDEALRQQVENYLSQADTGITEVKVGQESMVLDEKFDEFFKALVKVLPDGVPAPPDTRTTVQLGHKSGDGKIRHLDYDDESLGTRHLLALLPPVVQALGAGKVVIMDEITTSLHTHLSKKLISLFADKTINTKGAQLLCSTHDTNLLAPGTLRRDEIWFTEKDSEGITSVFPLTGIKTKNTDNIERGYLQGRFGGVPFVMT